MMIKKIPNLILSSIIFLITITLITSQLAAEPKEIGWNDLIPWTAVFNPSEVKFNKRLDGKNIKIPGYLIPLEFEAKSISEFMLVPYIGACIHVPPPPANQLIYVVTEQLWREKSMWEPVWVSGVIKINANETYIAESGYEIIADKIKIYEY